MEVERSYFGLNEGSYCSPKCVEALNSFNTPTSLRAYTESKDNEDLLKACAEVCQVDPSNIYLANGSGPILRVGIKHIVQKELRSTFRIIRHLLNGRGFPVISTSHTYSKVPKGCAKNGITVILIPLRPEDDYKLNVNGIRNELKRQDGLVYLSNPNNPTGNILITETQLEALVKEFPKSIFWIDEAYVQYVDPHVYGNFPPLVKKYPNLVISRSFSFAYGLAGLHVGYLIGKAELVQELNSYGTDYRISAVAEKVILAAISDKTHLPFIREKMREERESIARELQRSYPFIRVFPSVTNFLYARIEGKDPEGLIHTAKDFADSMKQYGIAIRTFEQFQEYTFPKEFRITVGLPHENKYLISKFRNQIPKANL